MARVRLVSPDLVGPTPEFAAGSDPVPGHILLTARDGMGRRTLARAFAAEYGVKCTEAASGALNQPGDLMGILTGIGRGDVLIVSDVGRLRKNISEFLAPALTGFAVDFVVDKGMFAKTINLPLKRFTCIATAHAPSEVRPELLEAFHLHIALSEYSESELQTICDRVASAEGMSLAPSAAALIARASARTPHHIQVLVRRLKATGRASISEKETSEMLQVLGLTATTVSLEGGSVGVAQLSGIEFERLVCELLVRMGFRTEMTEVSGDGGIDIVATLEQPMFAGRYLIQCKRFATDNLVGAATVRDFYGALTADRRAGKGILITTSGFSAQAIAFAENLPIEMIDGRKLRELLTQNGISTEILNAPPKPDDSLFD